MLHKIGIVGHSPENIAMFPEEKIKNMIRQTIDLLNYQYKTEVVFNVVGDIGVGLWAAEECINLSNEGAPIRYHMFLPYPQDITSEYWYDAQKESLKRCCDRAYSITISNFQKCGEEVNEHDLVQDSNFIICYWTGKKQGKTFSTIKYALESNKIVLNGLDELKLITNHSIKK